MTSQRKAPQYWKSASIREASGRVYHYGSARTLLGMVEDGVLWASEAAGVNDVAEIRGCWDFIENWLDEHRAPKTPGTLTMSGRGTMTSTGVARRFASRAA